MLATVNSDWPCRLGVQGFGGLSADWLTSRVPAELLCFGDF